LAGRKESAELKRSEIREAVFYLTFEKMFGGDTPDPSVDYVYVTFVVDGTVSSQKIEKDTKVWKICLRRWTLILLK
jgi:hypothetical protein